MIQFRVIIHDMGDAQQVAVEAAWREESPITDAERKAAACVRCAFVAMTQWMQEIAGAPEKTELFKPNVLHGRVRDALEKGQEPT